MHIFCFFVTNGSLNDFMREALFLGACQLFRDKKKQRCTFRTDHCEGFVRTKFEEASLDTIRGTKFAGLVAAANGKQVEATFVVRERDIIAEVARQDHFDRLRGAGIGPWKELEIDHPSDAELEAYDAVPPTRVFDA